MIFGYDLPTDFYRHDEIKCKKNEMVRHYNIYINLSKPNTQGIPIMTPDC